MDRRQSLVKHSKNKDKQSELKTTLHHHDHRQEKIPRGVDEVNTQRRDGEDEDKSHLGEENQSRTRQCQ